MLRLTPVGLEHSENSEISVSIKLHR